MPRLAIIITVLPDGLAPHTMNPPPPPNDFKIKITPSLRGGVDGGKNTVNGHVSGLEWGARTP